MTLAAGSRLGPYEILAPIGAGGMGEIYKARDTRLDASSHKGAGPSVAKNEDVRQRFEREADDLSHPHLRALRRAADGVMWVPGGGTRNAWSRAPARADLRQVEVADADKAQRASCTGT